MMRSKQDKKVVKWPELDVDVVAAWVADKDKEMLVVGVPRTNKSKQQPILVGVLLLVEWVVVVGVVVVAVEWAVVVKAEEVKAEEVKEEVAAWVVDKEDNNKDSQVVNLQCPKFPSFPSFPSCLLLHKHRKHKWKKKNKKKEKNEKRIKKKVIKSQKLYIKFCPDVNYF